MTRPDLNPQAAAVLLRQSAVSLRNDIPLADVIPILARDPLFNAPARDALGRLTDALLAGTALPSALAANRLFKPSTIGLIAAAPTDADRAITMIVLADDFEAMARGAGVIRIALIWPLFITLFAAFVIAFLTVFVFPVVSDLYGQFGYDMPFVTQFVQAVYPVAGLALILVLLVAWWVRIRAHRSGMPLRLEQGLGRLTDLLPFLNAHVHAQCTARLARWLLLAHRSPLLLQAAVLHLEATTASPSLKKSLGFLNEALANGEALSTALAKTAGFPVRVALYAQLGEKLNDVDAALSQLCTLCEAREAIALRRYESSVIVITYVVMAIVVGTLLVAVYSPLLRMGTII